MCCCSDEVLEDVNLIWKNCKIFNKGDPIVEDCEAAEQSFREGWLLAGLPSERLLSADLQSSAMANVKASPQSCRHLFVRHARMPPQFCSSIYIFGLVLAFAFHSSFIAFDPLA